MVDEQAELRGPAFDLGEVLERRKLPSRGVTGRRVQEDNFAQPAVQDGGGDPRPPPFSRHQNRAHEARHARACAIVRMAMRVVVGRGGEGSVVIAFDRMPPVRKRIQ